nr:hypothetical protein [uncultured Actinoplanes sp.]
MTPAERLTDLLETLPSAERQEITAWLLERQASAPARSWVTLSSAAPQATALKAAEETQLVGIRLSAERHAELRDWCLEHGFTMAAVVRGLIDRFLDQEAQR